MHLVAYDCYTVVCLYFLLVSCLCVCVVIVFFFQAEDGIRDLVRSRGLGDVYKRQVLVRDDLALELQARRDLAGLDGEVVVEDGELLDLCLLYTSDAADERSSVDLGGRRIIKKKTNGKPSG